MAIQTHGKIAITLFAVLSFIATVVVLLRFLRRRARGFIGADDWVLLMALAVLHAQNVFGYLFATKGGEGKPFKELTRSELKWFFITYYWPELVYCILNTLIKASILISYHRIFGLSKWCRNGIYFLTFLVTAWFIGVFFPFAFQCDPPSKAWKPHLEGQCFNLGRWFWGNSSSNFVIDCMILLFPVVPLLKLHLDTVEKTLVWCSFAMGSLSCMASLTRAVVNRTADFTLHTNSIFIVSVAAHVEPMLAVISACLPFLSKKYFGALYPFIARLFGLRVPQNHNFFDVLSDQPTGQARMRRLSSVSELRPSLQVPESIHTR